MAANSDRLQIEWISPDKLRPHPKNPRLHPDSAIAKLSKSIEKFGFTNPILVTKDGMIIAGHARWKASLRNGLKKVPIVRLGLQGADIDAYVIADNRLHYESQWDNDALKLMFEGFKQTGFDVELTGFDNPQIQELSFGEDLNPMACDPSGLGINPEFEPSSEEERPSEQSPVQTHAEKDEDEDSEGEKKSVSDKPLGPEKLGNPGATSLMQGNHLVCPYCGCILLVNERGEIVHVDDASEEEEDYFDIGGDE